MKFTKGQIINQWTLITRLRMEGNGRKYEWLARCSCGKTGYVREACLRDGAAAGCEKCVSKANRDRNWRHGLSYAPHYTRWLAMIARCHTPDNKGYELYGMRGIVVCERWRFGEGNQSGYECFCLDMGECPDGHSLDRRDNNGPYAKWNCRWATQKEQNANKRPKGKWKVNRLKANAEVE